MATTTSLYEKLARERLQYDDKNERAVEKTRQNCLKNCEKYQNALKEKRKCMKGSEEEPYHDWWGSPRGNRQLKNCVKCGKINSNNDGLGSQFWRGGKSRKRRKTKRKTKRKTNRRRKRRR